MVNILLPAYSRQYSALRGVGLVTAADEMENHELEHLVLRERGVVWADQEGVEQQMKGEGIGVESQEINHVGNAGLHSELAPVLSFSHLLYHQSSPCSKSSYSLSSLGVSFVCLFSLDAWFNSKTSEWWKGLAADLIRYYNIYIINHY